MVIYIETIPEKDNVGISLYVHVQAQETRVDQKQGYINAWPIQAFSARDEKKMAEGAFRIMKRTSLFIKQIFYGIVSVQKVPVKDCIRPHELNLRKKTL